MSPQDAPQAPALARAAIDRAADERREAGLLQRLRDDPASRVLAVHGDRTPVRDGRLVFATPSEVTAAAHWALLGRTGDGTAVLLAATGAGDDPPTRAEEWASLRAVGAQLDAEEAGLLVEAVALARWLVDAPFCPFCGTRLEDRAAGWSRSCPSCGREHFPRTDPAVIVVIADADDERLLLGRNALWGDRVLYSAFAGFVEAGESAESALVREVAEEAGVRVTDLRYRGSQAWPYPRSLMLGFTAVAADVAAARADGEEIVDVRWFTRAELRNALAGAGDIELPGPASIAHALIRDWVGTERS
ncbi:NAD(+) diphosphatase [Microbacterium telephonicum]|uniref:NAD(+) diphosphatase n=1 Tax=Microbacterium telephonicum TaxID=1714841 RepID=A0A498C086_9MICO|nr:NAD(+) diphosphatase [Microbacterium telephonicum]RLK49105.1 NAD+ diphosphatase [Microbacterium telephonicum]